MTFVAGSPDVDAAETAPSPAGGADSWRVDWGGNRGRGRRFPGCAGLGGAGEGRTAWVDPEEDLTFVGMIQNNGGAINEVQRLSRSLVYQAVVGD